MLDEAVTVLVAGETGMGGEPRSAAGGVEIIGRAATGNDAVNQVLEELPDILLLDVRIADIDARAVCRRVRQWAPATRIVAATPADDEAAYTAIVAGASGAVLFDTDDATLDRTLREVSRGEAVLLTRMAGRLMGDLDAWAHRSADPIYPPPTLTATEREVLTRLAAGDSATDVARSHAVTTHLVNLHAGFAVAKLHRYVHGSERIAADGHANGG